jgi:hypothetical protein
MHAELNSETLRAMLRDPNLYDEAALKILLWMLSHPGAPVFGLKAILPNSRYQRLSGVRRAVAVLRQAGYASLVGKGHDGLEAYQASPRPVFHDFSDGGQDDA